MTPGEITWNRLVPFFVAVGKDCGLETLAGKLKAADAERYLTLITALTLAHGTLAAAGKHSGVLNVATEGEVVSEQTIFVGTKDGYPPLLSIGDWKSRSCDEAVTIEAEQLADTYMVECLLRLAFDVRIMGNSPFIKKRK